MKYCKLKDENRVNRRYFAWQMGYEQYKADKNAPDALRYPVLSTVHDNVSLV